MGAVFNRDYPFNRGWKPLPPTIDFNLNDIEFYEVSYKRRLWPRAFSLIGKETFTSFTRAFSLIGKETFTSFTRAVRNFLTRNVEPSSAALDRLKPLACRREPFDPESLDPEFTTEGLVAD